MTEPKFHIIAFTGPRKVGKTTSCNNIIKIITDYNKDNKEIYTYKISFADFLRSFIESIFGPDIAANSIWPEMKDKKIEEEVYFNVYNGVDPFKSSLKVDIDMSYRDLLIKTGTFLRSLNEDIFCIALMEKINLLKKAATKYNRSYVILIDDLRFENELKFLQSINGDDIKVSTVFLDRNKYNINLNYKYLEPIDFIQNDKTDMSLTLETEETKENSLNNEKYLRELLTKIGII